MAANFGPSRLALSFKSMLCRKCPWLLTLGLHACINYPYEGSATNVVAFFDDVVVHNAYITTNPFETGEQYFWQCGFEYFEDLGPAWEVALDAACQPDGLGLRARLVARKTDPLGPIGCPRIRGELSQDFASPIPVECFTDSSVFKVQTKWGSDYCNPVPPEVWQLEILYTDDTSTLVDLSGDPEGEWVSHELKPVLEPGKKVKGIRFTGIVDRCGGPACGLTEVMVDNCTCTI